MGKPFTLETSDGLCFQQEGPHVRVTSPHVNFLFGRSRHEELHQQYLHWVSKTHAYFTPRWQSVVGQNLDAQGFSRLVQEITLHWMRYYVSTKLPLLLTESDWQHPQTRQIAQTVVERQLPPDAPEANALVAHLMNLSLEQYQQCKNLDNLIHNR